jgi:8-hydroxy-5-deazaflavin:NADPH oxidoreductase
MAKIAVVGTGRMGSGLGIGLALAGHVVAFGSRDPEARHSLEERAPASRVVGQVECLTDAEVAILTLPFAEVEPFARQNAAALRGKLVIDISNPFDKLPNNQVAGAEITARAIGDGARVVAAFKTNFAATLLDPIGPDGVRRDAFLAGDAEEDRQVVATLARDLGFRPIDCGSLHNARILDGMVPLMIELDRRYGGGSTRCSWKLAGYQAEGG